jgi:chorismate synthase
MKGSQHNDLFASNDKAKGELKLITNRSGGSLGGVSTGENF